MRAELISRSVTLFVFTLCVHFPAHGFQAPPPAPALPPPSGDIVNVSGVAQLEAAVANAVNGRTILIAAGTYNLTQPLVLNGKSNVTLRGATGNRGDVVIRGKGMTVNGGVFQCMLFLDGQNLTVADLSVGHVFTHPIQASDTRGLRVYNVRFFDAGEQFLKVNPVDGTPACDDGIVEYCVFEYTVNGPDDGYTNAVDVHAGKNWIIRNNLFKNIGTPAGTVLAGPAILMWRGAENTLTEANTFIDCARAIAYGFEDIGSGFSHRGGIIRNNFIYRRANYPWQDTAITLWDTPNTKVLHNSIYYENGVGNSIEWRFGSTGLEVRNNLCNKATWQRDGTFTGLLTGGNIADAAGSWFAGRTSGDLHLVATHADVIARVLGQAVAIASAADAAQDWDADARPVARDIGADEAGAAPPPEPTLTVSAPNGGETWTVGQAATVTWTTTGAVGNVEIRLSTNGGGAYASLVASTANDGSHTLTVPNNPGAQCRIQVRETDGTPADASNANFTIQAAPQPPAAPANLTAVAVSTARIDLAWQDASNNETLFRVQRSPGGANAWTTLGATAANATAYASTGLAAATAYDFRVRAENAAGNSAWSNVASATTQSDEPPPPAGDGIVGDLDLCVTAASFAVNAARPDSDTLSVTGVLNPRLLPAALAGLNVTLLVNGAPVAPAQVLDAAGRFAAPRGSSPSAALRFDALRGSWQFALRAADLADLLELPSGAAARAPHPLELELRLSGAGLAQDVRLANTLVFELTAQPGASAKGAFKFAKHDSLQGAFLAAKATATELPASRGGGHTLACSGFIAPDGAGPLTPNGELRITLGAADPIAIPLNAMAASGATPAKRTWSLNRRSPVAPGELTAFKFSNASRTFALKTAALDAGLPGAGGALVADFDLRLEVVTAAGTQRFESTLRLKRASAASTRWSR
ncbi:MAG: fibronectin type III domain-containing protein [Planctomycetes bacterium]|nr:fibronectin type III domain-containing protein [Planctomycetota bacterium]